jgi:hypothetical protein
MKSIIMIAGFFMFGAAHAEVFKCMDPSGKVIYQAKPCEAGSQGQVNIKAFDPNKIAEAQAKLAERVKQDAERQQAAAAAAQKERDIQSREAIAAQTRNQTDAINRNAQALENVNQAPPAVYYMLPPVTAPLPPPNNTPRREPRP